MISVFDRVSRLHRESHERQPPQLFHDWSAVEITEFRAAAEIGRAHV